MRRIIAVAIVKEGKILIAKRNYGSLAGYWEFPGGKVEGTEADRECIKREIMEEFSVRINVEEFLGEQQFLIDENEYLMVLYKATLLDQHIKLSVHSEIKWLEVDQLYKYKLAPVDQLLVQKGCLRKAI